MHLSKQTKYNAELKEPVSGRDDPCPQEQRD